MFKKNTTRRRIFNGKSYKENDLLSRYYGKLQCDVLFTKLFGKQIVFNNHSHKMKIDLVGTDAGGETEASLDVERCKNWVGEPEKNWEPYLYQRKLKLFSDYPKTFYWLKFNKNFSKFILLSINDFDGAVAKFDTRGGELLLYPREEVWRKNIYQNYYKDKDIEAELMKLNTDDVKYEEECEILQHFWDKAQGKDSSYSFLSTTEIGGV